MSPPVTAEAIAPLSEIMERFETLVAIYVEWLELAAEDLATGPVDSALAAALLAAVHACEAPLGTDLRDRAYVLALARAVRAEIGTGAMPTTEPMERQGTP